MQKERVKARLADLVLNEGQVEWLPSNPRRWTRTDIDKLKKSLQRDEDFQEDRPALAMRWEDKLLVFAGNLRTTAAKELKWKTLDTIIYTPESEEDKEAIIRRTILDNASFGEWDIHALSADWSGLPLTDWGVKAVWDEVTLEETPQAEKTEVVEDDFDEETDKVETRCKRGDIWQLGDHRLMCGDSTSLQDVETLMGGVKADMVLSDPPYGMCLNTDFSTCLGSLGSLGRKNHTRGNKYDKVIGDNDDFSQELINTFFKNFSCEEVFLFGADYYAELLPKKNDGSWLVWDKRKESQADAIGSEFELIWSQKKHKRRMLRHDWFGFLSSKNSSDARNRVHPTQKPISLLVDIIEQWGKNSEHIVDLYGGSGSTLMAAEQIKKKSFLMEIDPHYCDVIIARWEKYTGRKAEKIN